MGTIRSEQMADEPGWPESLLELGEDLRLLRVGPLNLEHRGAIVARPRNRAG